MRVKVWLDREHPLGEGTMLGCVPMTEVYDETTYKQNYRSFIERAVGKISDSKFEAVWADSRKNNPYSKRTTPKIQLDNGKIVYGCQIWWEEIP